jgi:hypothetical protein
MVSVSFVIQVAAVILCQILMIFGVQSETGYIFGVSGECTPSEVRETSESLGFQETLEEELQTLQVWSKQEVFASHLLS